jgi:phosphatidylserine decarboxylase
MPRPRLLERVSQHDAVNFVLTNRIPRALVTHAVGRISRSEHRLVRGVSMRLWTWFAGGLDLHEARKTHFASVHDCFVRELKDGARPIDQAPGTLVSPCDGIVGACGRVEGTRVYQAKGSPYTLDQLLGDPALVARHRDGCYVTLRLTSSMYHRFHAPDDCEVDGGVTYVAGDVWNVNPPALRRVERLFCKNERAVIPLRLRGSDQCMTLVPVAAILVASIRLHFLDTTLGLHYAGPSVLPCRATLRRGEQMGYFEHGSTILAFGTAGLILCENIVPGTTVRVGQRLMRHA